MRKKLSIIQIFCLVIMAVLPHIDGMFRWTCYTWESNISHKSMNLNNLMTIQQIGGGPLLYYLFYIALVLMAIYCTVELFIDNKIFKNKFWIAFPSIMLMLMVIMIIACNNYSDTFDYYGETRMVAVEPMILAYIQLTIILSTIIIECYKQIKCKE